MTVGAYHNIEKTARNFGHYPGSEPFYICSVISIPLLKVRYADILDNFETLCNDITAGLPAEIEARQKQYEYYRDKLLTFPPAE